MNLGLPEHDRKQIERFSVLSTRLLHTELMFVCESIVDKWEDWHNRLGDLEERGYLHADEKKLMIEALEV